MLQSVVWRWLVAPSTQLSATRMGFEWANLFQKGASQIWQTAARATAALQILQQFITSLQICSQGSDQQKNFINAWYQLYIVLCSLIIVSWYNCKYSNQIVQYHISTAYSINIKLEKITFDLMLQIWFDYKKHQH